MSVTVDHEALATGELGLRTVGQVLGHLQKDNRIVVQVLIDGQEPHPGALGAMRQTELLGHTVFIETADARALAIEVLDGVYQELPEAQRLKEDTAELLQRGMASKALEQLGGCIRIWQHAQEAVVKVGELLRIDLERVAVDGRPLSAFLAEFAGQLRAVKAALEQRDFVSLSDALLYEMDGATTSWQGAMDEMRELVRSLK